MIVREHLATKYSFFRFPNMHIIFLVPLIPSLIIVFLQNNLYMSENGTFGTVDTIIEIMVRDYFFYFKLILSIVASFFFVYRWSQLKVDKSYGFWITQGVDRNRFVVYATLAFSLLISTSEILGFLILNSYLGYHLPFITIFLTLISIIFSNILFSTIGIIIAEFLLRPEIAGLVFVALSFVNYTVFTDFDTPLSLIFKLESNFNSILLPFGILFELIFIGLLGTTIVYLQNLRDIDT